MNLGVAAKYVSNEEDPLGEYGRFVAGNHAPHPDFLIKMEELKHKHQLEIMKLQHSMNASKEVDEKESNDESKGGGGRIERWGERTKGWKKEG